MKKTIKDIMYDIKQHGLAYSFRKHGRRMILVILVYYLIRDTILYVLIPFFILGGFS